jgi:hypothetical protein
MELHDANKDGKLDKKELAAVPSLAFSAGQVDKSRDGAIDLAEMQARFEAHDQMSDLVAFDVQVSARGAPLSGATVTLTPEPFMGERKQSYVGSSTEGGLCILKGQEVELVGVPIGYYKVTIAHDASGANVTRGCEVADDLPTANRLAFDTQLATVPGATSGR